MVRCVHCGRKRGTRRLAGASLVEDAAAGERAVELGMPLFLDIAGNKRQF